MPPVRVPIKNTTAARTRNLFAYGFKGSSAVGKKAVADEVDSSESIGGGRAIEKSEAIASQGVDGSSVPLEAAAEEAPAPTLAAAPAAVSPPPLRRPLKKPLYKGIRHAEFCDDRHEWEGKYHEQIGTSTRKITLGSSFVLTEYVPYLTYNTLAAETPSGTRGAQVSVAYFHALTVPTSPTSSPSAPKSAQISQTSSSS